jgi:hypothetical protein
VLAEGGYKRGGRGGGVSRSLMFDWGEVPISWWRRKTCKCATIRRPPHHGQGTTPCFYRPRGGGLQSCRIVLELCMEVWRTTLWSWWLSWRISPPSGVVASPVPAQKRLRGWLCGCLPLGSSSVCWFEGVADGRPEDAQWRGWRCLVVPGSHSAGDGAAVPGMGA